MAQEIIKLRSRLDAQTETSRILLIERDEARAHLKIEHDERERWIDVAEELRAEVAIYREALESIAAEKCKPSFDEQLHKLDRAALISIVDTDTRIAREALAQHARQDSEAALKSGASEYSSDECKGMYDMACGECSRCVAQLAVAKESQDRLATQSSDDTAMDRAAADATENTGEYRHLCEKWFRKGWKAATGTSNEAK
jgi:hypothetical protein